MDVKLHQAKTPEKVLKYLKELEDHNCKRNGESPLHSYVRRTDKNKSDCLIALLVYGNCDVNMENEKGLAPLHIAAELNDVPSAKALLAFGCEVNCLNPVHCTPLDIALDLHGEGEMVTLLVSVGGQTGEATTKDLYVLRTLRFGTSYGPGWVPQGYITKETYTGDHPDSACSPPRPSFLPVTDSQQLDDKPNDSSEPKRKEKTRPNEEQDDVHWTLVRGDGKKRDTRVRFQTPDDSVTQALTLESIARASLLKVDSVESSITSWYQTTPPPSMPEVEEEQLEEKEEGEEEEEEEGEVKKAMPTLMVEETDTGAPDWMEPRRPERERAVNGVDHGDLERKLYDTAVESDGEDGYTAYLRWKALQKEKRRRGRVTSSIMNSIGVHGPESSLVGRSLVPAAFRMKTGERVLCLDGGGIRGLVQLEILRHIEELTHRKITELFDWIVGTSTGGIIALGMVYANMSCDELRQLYFEMKDKVFKNPRLKVGCNTPALEELLKRRFGEEAIMSDVDKPKVLVTAVDKSNTDLSLRFFNNCFDNEYSNVPVWKVARYTSAAPVYFTECDNYVDGGVKANNPCDYALTIIQDHLKAQRGHTARVCCVVSVGCGIYPAATIGNTDVLLAVSKNIVKMVAEVPSRLKHLLNLFATALTASEGVAENCRSRCEHQTPPIPYYRFSPRLADAVDTIETRGEKLCDLIMEAKMLVQNYSTDMDTLVQHFYYTAVNERAA